MSEFDHDLLELKRRESTEPCRKGLDLDHLRWPVSTLHTVVSTPRDSTFSMVGVALLGADLTGGDRRHCSLYRFRDSTLLVRRREAGQLGLMGSGR